MWQSHQPHSLGEHVVLHPAKTGLEFTKANRAIVDRPYGVLACASPAASRVRVEPGKADNDNDRDDRQHFLLMLAHEVYHGGCGKVTDSGLISLGTRTYGARPS